MEIRGKYTKSKIQDKATFKKRTQTQMQSNRDIVFLSII